MKILQYSKAARTGLILLIYIILNFLLPRQFENFYARFLIKPVVAVPIMICALIGLMAIVNGVIEVLSKNSSNINSNKK